MSKKIVVGAFLGSGLLLCMAAAALPIYAKLNSKMDAGEFMIWIEESPVNQIANSLFSTTKKRGESRASRENGGDDPGCKM